MITHPPRPAMASSAVGRKVRLREIAPSDHRTLARFDRGAARSGYRHWGAHRASSGDEFRFAIETLDSGVVVGSLGVVRTGRLPDRFSYGIGIGRQHRRCGYAADAVAALLPFMFRQLGYRRCEVSIDSRNRASLALHAGLGFREEGRQRDVELLLGQVKYTVLMGITDREFAVLHPDAAGRHVSMRGRHWRDRRGRHWRTRRGTSSISQY